MKWPGAARLATAWAAVRDSLWFLPGTMSIAAVALSFLTIQLDRTWDTTQIAGRVLYGGSAEGARAVLSVIAGSLITVTGVIFSVTIVALQLASTQFTPRVLRNFTANRGNQLVMGVFIGTFTYTLMILRAVRSAPEQGDPFVPPVAVAVAIALLLVSIGFLIFFVHHAARSIQASFLLDSVTRNSIAIIDTQREHLEAEQAESHGFTAPRTAPLSVVSGSGGYVQHVDEPALINLIKEQDLHIRLERRVGEYVMTGEALASVWPADQTSDIQEQIASAVLLGADRTPDQDIEYGIIEISDIAVKALSPGINDPTTALLCIDHLGEILARLAQSGVTSERQTRVGSEIRFTRPIVPWSGAVRLGFDQIRHFGTSNPVVADHAADILTRLRKLVPAQCRPAIDEQLRMMEAAQREARRSSVAAGADDHGRTRYEA